MQLRGVLLNALLSKTLMLLLKDIKRSELAARMEARKEEIVNKQL